MCVGEGGGRTLWLGRGTRAVSLNLLIEYTNLARGEYTLSSSTLSKPTLFLQHQNLT